MLKKNMRFKDYQLTTDIKTSNEGLLLKKGTILTKSLLERLSNFNIDIEKYTQYLKQSNDQLYKKVDEQVVSFQKEFDQFEEGSSRVEEIERELVPEITKLALEMDIHSLMMSMKSHDDYTYRHNIAVAMLSAKLATWLGYSIEEVNRISFCGLLHDLGKTKIPGEILNKEAPLTNHEFAVMKHHTTFGYELLKKHGLEEDVCLVALEHHEREDGSGYPNQKQSADIHPYAKIIAVVDCFHAMTSDRCYRKAHSFYETLKQLHKDSFGKLDPRMTHTFIHKTMQSAVGSIVQLNNGAIGTIKFVPIENPIFPLVEVEGEIMNTILSHTYIKQFVDEDQLTSI